MVSAYMAVFAFSSSLSLDVEAEMFHHRVSTIHIAPAAMVGFFLLPLISIRCSPIQTNRVSTIHIAPAAMVGFFLLPLISIRCSPIQTTINNATTT
jgi:hypothetical protein